MGKPWRTLIVDDEDLARGDLKNLLSRFPLVEVVGEADSITSAAEAVECLNPDLIFLDIQFPGESGFDLLGKIDSGIKIIFVTAFDDYAIRAFEVNAQDYLLKPVNPDRLAIALERLSEDRETQEPELRKLGYDDAVFLDLNNRYHLVKVNTIMRIDAAGNYTEILTSKPLKGLTQKSMKEWELRLPENSFIRIHRSTIVNLEFIDRIEPWFNYSYRVYLKGIEKPVVMSRRFALTVRKKLA